MIFNPHTPNNLLMKLFYSILLLFGLLLFSCTADEDLFAEALAENMATEESEDESDESSDDEQDDPEDPTGADGGPDVEVDPEGTLEINTTPCEYTLDTLAANDVLEIDCQIDLGGQTVNLPPEVTLLYNGGEIINGTLNFSGGKIDGNLMNQWLELNGNVTLYDEIFHFHPERWDFVQGQTNSDNAQKNNTNLEGLFYYTKELGANVFSMDQFDAYFEVSKVTSTTTNQNFYPSLEAINLPSNFTLSMTDNTVLRVLPFTNGVAATLMAIREVENVTIKGGVLYGDRDIRQYSGENSEEGAHLLTVRSGTNVLLDGVKFTKGSAGGLNINSVGFSFQPEYDPTTGLTVRSCVFDSNRMMSIALTDGRNVVIEDNLFLNNGQVSTNSDGGVVGYAINLEPVRTRDPVTNELIEYQKVQDVLITGNEERNSREGAIIVFIGQRITIENNTFETTVSYALASDTSIRNNDFIASSTSAGKPAIIAGSPSVTVFNNEIRGNNISGYGLAIALYYNDISVANNEIINCNIGIQLKEVTNVDITGNFIQKSSGGRGIMGSLTTAENINISNNTIDVQDFPFYFVELNNLPGTPANTISIFNNDLLSSAATIFSKTKGVNFYNNTSNGGIQLINASLITVADNMIATDSGHGIHLKQNTTDVDINDNNIDVGGNFQCILDEATGTINLENNSCL